MSPLPGHFCLLHPVPMLSPVCGGRASAEERSLRPPASHVLMTRAQGTCFETVTEGFRDTVMQAGRSSTVQKH